ncbi:MAG: sensor histidine kinase [Acidimicrobiales bacterium]
MTTRRRSAASPLSIVLSLLVVALTIGAFFVVRHNVENQDNVLLETQAEQVTQLLQTDLSQQATSLAAIAAVAEATGGSTSLFLAEAMPFTQSPNTTVALVRAGQVLAAAGHGLVAGQSLPGPLAAAVARGGPRLSASGVLRIGGEQVVAFIVGGATSGFAVVDVDVIHPSVPSATAKGPYKQVNVAVYAASTARPSELLVTTTRSLPLHGPVVDTKLPVGSSQWVVLTSARTPLAGTWPNAFPWILLAVGIVLALVLGAVVGLLARRERYALRMVAERTEELEASQHELVRRERLSAVGQMATMIGHELRNPLGASINGLFLARQRLLDHEDPELDRALNLIEREINRAAALAEDLTAFMREREPNLETLDVRSVVDEVLESAPPPPGTTASLPVPGVSVHADKALLVQMLTNLITNAYQAMPDGGSVRIAASDSDGFVEIAVIDSGAGVDPVTADRIFDPFFTTKPIGTGLGLAIVKRLVEAHDGTVTIENGPTGGAQAVVHLPRSPRGATT